MHRFFTLLPILLFLLAFPMNGQASKAQTAAVTITATATTGGVASVNDQTEVQVNVGDRLVLKASADYGYRFVHWAVGDEKISSDPIFTTTAQTERVYTAVFEEVTEGTVRIQVKGSGGYAYVGDGTDRRLDVEKGTKLKIWAKPTEGYAQKFSYWTTGNTMESGRGVILTNKNPYEFVAYEDMSFYVNFVDDSVDLNVIVKALSSEGGSADVDAVDSKSVALGAEVTYMAVALQGYHFVGWKAAGEENYQSTEPKYTTVVRGAMELTACFAPNETTGLETVQKSENKNTPIYNLSGKRVISPIDRGIYIVGGKKVLNK